MAHVRDVAEKILGELGPISAWKLQKLVYYSQAWHLVWDEEPLFESEIQAWANGPVCRDLYDMHRRLFTVSSVRGKPDALTASEEETVGAVLKFYNKFDGQQLSDLTHKEKPWLNARKGLGEAERGENVISHEALAEYYGSL